jgi:large subunit ribosomal protein L22
LPSVRQRLSEGSRMEALAVTRFVVMSPRKAKLTADLIKGKPVNEAIAILRFMPRKAAETIIKTLQSAVANAIDKEGSGKLDVDELFVRNAVIDPGPIMPRWRPRAYGRASRIRKRMSHIKVIVSTEMPQEYKESRRGRSIQVSRKRRKRKKKK